MGSEHCLRRPVLGARPIQDLCVTVCRVCRDACLRGSCLSVITRSRIHHSLSQQRRDPLHHRADQAAFRPPLESRHRLRLTPGESCRHRSPGPVCLTVTGVDQVIATHDQAVCGVMRAATCRPLPGSLLPTAGSMPARVEATGEGSTHTNTTNKGSWAHVPQTHPAAGLRHAQGERRRHRPAGPQVRHRLRRRHHARVGAPEWEV